MQKRKPKKEVAKQGITSRNWFRLGRVGAIGYVGAAILYAYSIYLNHSLAYSYLVFNLALATIPILVAWRIVAVLGRKRWSAWEPLVLTLIWLVMLPNSFYMISDFIHLASSPSNFLLYNAVLFASFISLAVATGFSSLYLIHVELRKRISPRIAGLLIAMVLLGCCVAIYLGRDLRWNSWDILTNPAGVLFDISNLMLQPQKFPDMGRTIISFFVLLGSSYLIVWQSSRAIWQRGVSDLASHLKKQPKHS